MRLRFNPFTQTHLIRLEKVSLIELKADEPVSYLLQSANFQWNFLGYRFYSEKSPLLSTEDQTSRNGSPAPTPTMKKKDDDSLAFFPLLDLRIEYLDGFVIQQDDN